jgi:AcrR family transcriptional regulator
MTTVIKNPTRRERKKADARARILATAVRLFAKRGLENTTVEKVAEAADIGKGTIYNYFSTKEDIVVAFMAELEARVQAKVSTFAAAKAPLREILAEFIRFQFRLKRPYHKFVRVFMAQMFANTEQFLPYLARMQNAIDPPLETFFADLQRRGLVRRDVHISELVPIFKTMHMGLSALWAVEGPPFRSTEKTLRATMKLFAEGLGEKDR